ncbi:porin [Thioalkalivibrio sp. AKL19]|uniref:porin n=1 Tax=Thioalkalivibrio sp. AKL19 TaxID=1266914 RepID=UPI0004236BD9|nr:porin [Thioalkalivibrio sp. AKL19]
MKKQILAVAVAGAFAVPAFAAADTNVTLFGQLQTQIVHQSASGDARFNDGFRVMDGGGTSTGSGSTAHLFSNNVDGANPNRIGVMVNHDLGNGLTALAKIEQNVTTTDGFNSGARDAYVGLDGDFGRVTAGRMSSPYSTAGKDPLNGTFMQQRVNGGRLAPGGFGWGGFANGSYLDRGLRYSNDFGMVNLDVAAFIDNSNDSDTAYAAKLGFDVGPVEIYGAYQRADDNNQTSGILGFVDGTTNDDDDATATKLRTAKIGVDFRQGPWRVNFEAEDFTAENENNITGMQERSGNTYFAAGTYSMGSTDFSLTLGHTSNDPAGQANVDSVAFGVTHHMSNRVRVFGGVAHTDVKSGGPDYTAVGGGMRVSF